MTFRGHLRSRMERAVSQSLFIAFLKSEFKTFESRRASEGVCGSLEELVRFGCGTARTFLSFSELFLDLNSEF